MEQGRRYSDKSLLVDALNITEEVIGKGPKYPATFKKDTSKEKKVKQEYANALKTKCDILIELARVSEKEPYVRQPLPQTYSYFPHLHFRPSSKDCDFLNSHISIDSLPTSPNLRTCAVKASNEAIDKYPENNPELPGAYVSKGIALQSIGKYDDAVRAFEEAIVFWEKNGRDPNGAFAWGGKGNVLLAKGEAFTAGGNHEAAVRAYEDAVKAYDMAIWLKPDNADTWFNKGFALRAQGKYDEAIHAYDKDIEFQPLHSDAWIQRGNILVEQATILKMENLGHIWLNTSDAVYLRLNYYYREALKSYSMSIDINPLDKVAWDNKGNVLTYQGNYSEAIRAHDKAIMLDTKYALAHSNKGFTLFHQGKYNDANEAYNKAIQLNPDFAKAWNGKGKALKALGRTSEANAAFDKAKELGYGVTINSS